MAELIKDNLKIDDILDTKLTIFSYTTADDPGTLIINSSVNPKLKDLFEDNSLFVMEDVKMKQITIRDILEQGVLSVGSTDLMETVSICYPDPRLINTKPLIKGLYMHGSRRRLIAEPLETEFTYDPDSDHETFNFDNDSFSDNEDVTSNNKSNYDMNWLCNDDR